MRAFIVLCLVAASCADKLGYNYRPVGHSDFGLSFRPGGVVSQVPQGVVGVSNGVVGGSGYQGSLLGYGGVGSNQGIGAGGHNFGSGYENSVVSGSNGGSRFPHFGVGGSNAGPGFASSGGVDASGSASNNGGVAYAPQVEFEKEFYTFTANENDFAAPHVENQVVNSAKKGLRVIFIKGPESNGLENAAVALAKHIAEQKTAIYVLQKQPDLNSLSHKLNTINSNVNHKPEVHFVKYRTHEDAVNAQKAIQSQYDSLGGVSNNFNGGEAPVLNFASKGPASSQGSHEAGGSSGSVGSSGSHGLSGVVGSSGPTFSSANFGSSGSVGSSGHVGSSGSIGSSVTLGSSSLLGSLGSSGDGSLSNTYVPPSAPSSTYLPA